MRYEDIEGIRIIFKFTGSFQLCPYWRPPAGCTTAAVVKWRHEKGPLIHDWNRWRPSLWGGIALLKANLSTIEAAASEATAAACSTTVRHKVALHRGLTSR